MGRKTFHSIGSPLPSRYNIVLSRNPKFKAKGVDIIRNIDEIKHYTDVNELMVIGGGEIYKQMMPYATRMLLSYIDGGLNGDVYFPKFKHSICQSDNDNQLNDNDQLEWNLNGVIKYDKFEVKEFTRNGCQRLC